ncbi:hypothetical protein Dtox_3590 [Desulfofarcimen acetoxidans DSM 771]|jgi:hypothetical protein|uniref:Uncharacterized protein n=1 Tax=Desulfofarcimen acetoxidans (strain ATCC 49208 / DSM 771 / KCTC 5769 / VKM B-1644 / 5575) TaxID=485916 RepID=C8VW15_DESAS|nr:hypothetical protein [Desulfofarcimen acetoxidans]ACV64302.1 hypothetical protein Dtox_3590 [Desulfofarcimen acetoxidans DSM 771]
MAYGTGAGVGTAPPAAATFYGSWTFVLFLILILLILAIPSF